VKRNPIARQLARQERLPQAAAHDQIDEMVHKILERLRKGKPVNLPGLGKLVSKAEKKH
jgi:nucleoid DNA-binding protein